MGTKNIQTLMHRYFSREIQDDNDISGSFTGTGASSSGTFQGFFDMSLSGFGTATVVLQRSFDSGSTWKNVESHTADVEKIVQGAAEDVLYRLNCTAYTSGTIAYRLKG